MKARFLLLIFTLAANTFVSAQRNNHGSNNGGYHRDYDRSRDQDCHTGYTEPVADEEETCYDNTGEGRGYNGPGRSGCNSDARIAYQRRPLLGTKDFSIVLMSISREHFDSDRIRTAKAIASRHSLSTLQIIKMVRLLRFDSSRLEFARHAYVSCIDPGNYYRVGDSFTFSSSRRALMDYLQRI